MEVLAIIPARGGSKGIPRKNIVRVAGIPLIGHIIIQAVGSRMVSRVIVSTDDSDIERISKSFGAEVVRRPVVISGDNASSEEALLHVLEAVLKKDQYSPDVVVFLQCTSPLTVSMDIDGVIKCLFEKHADTALAVTPFHYFIWEEDEEGNAVGINHDKMVRELRQKRPRQFLETGAVYAMKTKGFKEAKHRFFGKTAIYIMPPERCLEIDELVDLKIAEVLLQERQWQQTEN